MISCLDAVLVLSQHRTLQEDELHGIKIRDIYGLTFTRLAIDHFLYLASKQLCSSVINILYSVSTMVETTVCWSELPCLNPNEDHSWASWYMINWTFNGCLFLWFWAAVNFANINPNECFIPVGWKPMKKILQNSIHRARMHLHYVIMCLEK